MPGELVDFGALAARLVANLDDIRACLLMSHDGLTLGAYPKDGEEAVRDVWNRLRSIGDPERGFLSVGDELWILARRGPYVGLVIAAPGATPGLLLDRLEFTLRSAEELRLREEAPPRGEATRRPRTLLHPDRPDRRGSPQPADRPAGQEETVDLSTELARDAGTPPAPEEALADPVRAALEFAQVQGGGPNVRKEAPGNGQPARRPLGPIPGDAGGKSASLLKPRPAAKPAPAEQDAGREGGQEATVEPPAEAGPEPEAKPEAAAKPEPTPRRPARDDAEVDPVALAREFAHLINEPDEES